MSKFEEFRKRQLAEKYGIPDGKLQTTTEFKLSEPAPHVSRYHQQYIDGIRRKWGIAELQIEGRCAPEKQGETVKEMAERREREEIKNLQLSYGTVDYKGEALTIFYLKPRR